MDKNRTELSESCPRWTLNVNLGKSKILVFKKGGKLSLKEYVLYNEKRLDIVNKFSYIGLIFATGVSFQTAQATIAGQAHKAIVILHRYFRKFVNVTPCHVLDLFHKLVTPIL